MPRRALARSITRDEPLITALDQITATLGAEIANQLFGRNVSRGRERRTNDSITIQVSYRYGRV